MAKSKEGSPIIGIRKNLVDRLVVQKSNPLYGLWRSELSLAEFKILDTYLSRINSHDPEHRTVCFEKGEIEELLEVRKINIVELKKRLNHLGIMVPVDDPINDKKFRLISLFERADCEQEESGVWQVYLTCTPSAMKYIFNIEDMGYFRYKLRVIASLRSRYSYILFLYLEKNRSMHMKWEINVDELRILLRADSETYQTYKRFNDLILKPVQKELNKKTDCQFTYEPIRKGRKIISIRFLLKPIRKEAMEKETIQSDKIRGVREYTELEFENHRDKICHGFSDLEFEGFTDEQLRFLKELGWPRMCASDLKKHEEALGSTNLAYEYATADYLRRVISLAKTRNPKNLFLYVKKVIENEW